MPLVIADRVLETTSTTGTGTVTLAGAVTGYQSFGTAVGDGNTTYYTIAIEGGTDWEVGIGTYTASGTTLSRDTVLASSNSGNLVSFGSGSKNVFVTYPGARAVYYQAAGGVVVTDNSSNDALRITQTGAGNALVVEDSANPDSTPFVVNADGRVFVGYSSSITLSGVTSGVQSAGTGNEGNFAAIRYTDTADTGAAVAMVRSRGSTPGTSTLLQDGDRLGTLRFYGADGSDYRIAASIAAFVDGTPGASDMPGRLQFQTTPDGASAPSERMRIASTGAIGLSGANYGTAGQTLTSQGSSSTPIWSNPGIISALVFGL